MNLRKTLCLVLSVSAIAAFAAPARAAMEDKPAPPAEAVAAAPAKPAVTIDVKAALATRSMGDPKAPVRLDEYASLSCPHCAEFTKDTFDKIKAAYIDTGKVFYTYTDIPLNAPALEAAMVARCMPAAHYFDFVKILFTTQDKWAFNDKYETSLRQSSKLLGMSDETFDACVGNQELKLAIVSRMDEMGKANHIESTPSFIINGKLIHGALPFEDFQKVIDPLLNKGALKK